jgi:hypothetical protein
MLALAAWTQSWIVGVLGFTVLLVALWLYAERPAGLRRLIRNRK